ncbi:adenosine deaminase [Psychromonas ingrahamii 37]|uniref:Adenosine deaminase n=1 Tax=Psychromonas ingrahamii (strain DSM 17664 / CCUG 51855 / 37) TaxID=357804 RepID=A1SUV7_PSYIN|nr:adenosine deaminase [Psychromonas ingrahamii]ABM03272.1 adenosine deaminase [Psychromonas ingrahamii 37]
MITNTLPLTDLHRHLDGNIRIETILELGQKFALPLPAYDIEGLRPYVQVVENEADLMAFLSKLDWGVAVLGDLDACRRIAYENVQDVMHAKIDYAELRFSPYYMAMKHNLPLAGVVEAVVDGVHAGCRDFSVKANLIGIMSRTFGKQRCQQELAALLTQKDKLVAIDLAGDELGHPGEHFVEHFKTVRNANLQVTVHAGEAAGASSIWQAINKLGATRIGHGVKAIEDPTLLDYLVKHKIGIESCLTSNSQTSTVSSFAKHPIKTFLAHGVLACLNSDDPAVEGIELAHEYQVAATKVGLNQDQIRQAQINGLEVAFLSDAEKAALRNDALNR